MRNPNGRVALSIARQYEPKALLPDAETVRREAAFRRIRSSKLCAWPHIDVETG